MRELHAVIAVWHRDSKTYYVKRSDSMENYPGVWTHMSVKFRLEELPDSRELDAAQVIMDRLSAERLGGTDIRVVELLSAATSSTNPINVCVHLSMYRVELAAEPRLNPRFYTDGKWMTHEEYAFLDNPPCGTCIRMWSDYCVANGLSDLQLAAPLEPWEYRA